MTTLKTSHAKPTSAILPNAIASVIDAVFITVIDCAVMYAFWVIGMAMGALDSDPGHWQQLVFTAPLFFVDGLTVIALPASLAFIDYSGALYDQTFLLANSFFISAIVVNWLFHAGFESSFTRGTPGQVFMDLRLTTRGGGRIGFTTATIRHFGKFISCAILFLGFLPIFGSQRDRSLHDVIAKSRVVHDET